MTPAFQAELHRRISLNEGCRLASYQDSLGVWTIGVGFNLERGDAHTILAKIGVVVPNGWEHLRITQAQCDALLAMTLVPIVELARASLIPNCFDNLVDARKFVICDLEFNLGDAGWCDFVETRGLIGLSHYAAAASHLQGSAWFGQVADRGVRDVAMMRSGVWVPQ